MVVYPDPAPAPDPDSEVDVDEPELDDELDELPDDEVLIL